MKQVLILTALLISFSTVANNNRVNEKTIKESHAIVASENVNAIQLSGTIVDDKNKETLAGVSIMIAGKRYYSDLNGDFVISDVKPGKYEITVELISYDPVSVEVDLNRNRKVNIALLQK